MASPALPFATYRFRNIPAHFNEESFASIVPLADRQERILNASLAPNSYLTVKADQVGTITFSTIPRAIAQLKLKESESTKIPLPSSTSDGVLELSAEENGEAVIDSHFSGFTVLNRTSVQEESIIE